jgi:protein TonB
VLEFMSSIVKETEFATPDAAPTRPASSSLSSSESAGKPQAVALEVSVTVNGARTVDGTDKREPFSESTKTVLVFGNGAVIRLQSSVTPGQLLFLTNEKTKKEVVCQVVKSKNYRNVSGYVELEFTEPVPGFWGMRFPGERIAAPTLATPASGQVTPLQAASPAIGAPATPSAITPPIAVTPLPEHAPARRNTLNAFPAFSAQTAGSKDVSKISVSAEKFVAAPVAVSSPSSAPVSVTEKQPAGAIPGEPKLPTPAISSTVPVSPVSAANPSSPVMNLGDLAPMPVPAKPPASSFVVTTDTSVSSSASKSVPSLSSVITLPRAADVKPSPTAPLLAPDAPATHTPAALASSPDSTESLRAENARLQQQLSALLSAETKKAAPAPASTPAATVKPAADAAAKVLEIARPNLFANAPAKPAATPTPSLFANDELKIPSWLEPLARNAAISATTKDHSPNSSNSSLAQEFHAKPASSLDGQDVSAKGVSLQHAASPEIALYDQASDEQQSVESIDNEYQDEQQSLANVLAPNFGTRLLIDENSDTTGSAPRSKKTLFLAIAAAVILAAFGGLRYTSQGASLLNSLQNTFASSPSAPAPAVVVAREPSPSSPNDSQASASASAPSSLPASRSASIATSNAPTSGAVKDMAATPSPLNANLMVSKTPAASPVTASAGTPKPNSAQPELPAQKRASLGDVHLSAPTVAHRSEENSIADADPALSGAAAQTEVLSSANFATSSGPSAPVATIAVGGDVKNARLLKSVPPLYPAFAKEQRIGGDVKIDALIDATGKVTSMKVLDGPALLHQAAMEALRQWRYQPATLNGNAIPMHLTVTLQFRMQ